MQTWPGVLLLVACGSGGERPTEPIASGSALILVDAAVADARIALPAVDAALPLRRTIVEAEHPMNMAVIATTVYWTDSRGQLWAKPWQGPGPIRRIATPERVMFLGVHRGELYVTIGSDLLHVPNQDPPAPMGLALDESVLDIASDGQNMFVSLYGKHHIYRIDGKVGTKLVAGNDVIVRDGRVYAKSYGGGTLHSIPVAGGVVKTIARGLPKPTGFAVDDTYAFVWCEQDKTLRRLELATGASKTLVTGSVNTDVLVEDGDWVYFWSWELPKSKLLRVRKDGTKTETIADDLGAPHDIKIDDTGVFVVDRDGGQIIRWDKARL